MQAAIAIDHQQQLGHASSAAIEGLPSAAAYATPSAAADATQAPTSAPPPTAAGAAAEEDPLHPRPGLITEHMPLADLQHLLSLSARCVETCSRPPVHNAPQPLLDVSRLQASLQWVVDVPPEPEEPSST